MSHEQILREAAGLPLKDRVTLIDQLIETLDQEQTQLPDALRDELDRRAERARRIPELAEPWEVVRERLLRGLSDVQSRRPA